MRSGFDQTDAVHAQYDKLLDLTETWLPVVHAHLDTGPPGGPRAHRNAPGGAAPDLVQQPHECLNREIRRCTDVFAPSRTAPATPDSSAPCWPHSTTNGAECGRYLGLEVLGRSRLVLVATDNNHDNDDTASAISLIRQRRMTRSSYTTPRDLTSPAGMPSPRAPSIVASTGHQQRSPVACDAAGGADRLEGKMRRPS